LSAAVDATGAHVIFTDLPAGSCTLAARRVHRERGGLTIIAGANLPMLLDFVLRDDAGPAEAAVAAERGREHIRVLDAPDGR
jgi:PTS system N-acetylgalactosamine-specific IIA component